MTKSAIPLLALLLASFSVSAQGGWRDSKGNPVPETESAKSVDGFSAMLVVTPDKDWQEKWNTPPEVAPQFSTAREVREGGELFILAFLANPKVDAANMTDVACDFVVERPDGTKSYDESNSPCFKTELRGDPRSVYLSSASLQFVAEPSDPKGTWVVSSTVKDRLRGVEIPLRTSFEVR